ncbi:MAG: PEP-CTERM sorting domain-containing protein [Planctomycetia bacterium]|nr:PEP-CTERM sorting domain-containing protein [Planctomycetia bacterium]
MLHKSLASSSLAARAAVAGAALAMLASGLAAQSARASLLVYEPFNYTSGSTLNGQTATGTGLTGTWGGSNTGTISAGSLSEGNLATADNSYLSGGGNNTISFVSNITATTGNPVWGSFLLNTPSNVASNYGGLVLEPAAPTSSAPAPFIGISNSGHFLVQKYGSSDNTVLGTAASANTTYLLVFEDIANATSGGPDTLNLWVNPTAGAANPPATPDVSNTYSTSPIGAISGIDLANGGGFSYDEVRIGTTYADVTPAVPEPATLGLVAIGAMGLLLLKRRRIA